jgi:hypothetical protein
MSRRLVNGIGGTVMGAHTTERHRAMILENHVSTSAEQSRSDRSSTSAHTPGPWLSGGPSSVVGWPVVQPASGRMICEINYVQRNQIDPVVSGDRAFNIESAANARLIVAAPNLLAALREIEWIFDGQEDINNNGGPNDAMKALTVARAAISKATGA